MMNEKVVYLLAGGVASFFLPLYGLLFWIFAFVMGDLITGILAAKKRGELLQSKKLKRTITKLVWYTSAIVLIHGLDVSVVQFVDLHGAQVMAGLICGVEFYSILENCFTITENRVFWILTQFTTKKVKEFSGVDIEEEKTK